MRSKTIRAYHRAWDLVEDEARREGVGVSEYVRAAMLARAIWDRAKRDAEPDRTIQELVERLGHEHP